MAVEKVRVCSCNDGVLLQTPVQFQLEAILVLLLYGTILFVFSPILHTFTQKSKHFVFNGSRRHTPSQFGEQDFM